MEVTMNFRIQASNPKNNTKYCKEDKKLSEAIETIFPMLTEDAILVWNTINIPLSYKYDISYMIDDILSMLKKIRENPNGNKMKICWPSNTFACDWILNWNSKMLTINSKWRSVAGHTENLLNESNEINIDIFEFTYEWKTTLKTLIINLEQCGYDKENIKDMDLLYYEFESINKYGLLYRDRVDL